MFEASVLSVAVGNGDPGRHRERDRGDAEEVLRGARYDTY